MTIYASKGKANSKADIQHDHLTACGIGGEEELLDSCIRTAKAQSTSFLAVLLDINLNAVNAVDIRRGSDPTKGSRKIRSSLQNVISPIRLGGDEVSPCFQQLSKKSTTCWIKF